MNRELELRLQALGAALDVPLAPDSVPKVLERLPVRRAPRRRPVGRTLAVVVAAMLLLAGAAMAVAPSRHAILHFIGLRGVSITRVRRLPPIPHHARTGTALVLGRPIPFASARHAAGFRALLPRHASAAYLAHDVPGGRISLLVGRMLITEFRGTAYPFIDKLLDPGTGLKAVRVNGGQGAYISGAPHQVLVGTANGQVRSDSVRLAGNVLIWQQGRLIIRLEGTHTLSQALALARSLR